MEDDSVMVVTDLERKVLQAFELLKELCVDPEATPCVKANSQKALASVWQIANDLGLAHEQLFELGV
ncbi:MAG: hypothetical protein HYY30_03695 [Chloroflexi bacterium]|nr:hypothetical protein [Chloroflexota bacterium]